MHITIKERFKEIGTQSFDKKSRVTIKNNLRLKFPDASRVLVYVNEENGDILLRPMMEVPIALFKNKKVLESLQRGIKKHKNSV